MSGLGNPPPLRLDGEMTEPNLITDWMSIDGVGGSDIGKDLKFCNEVMIAINRHPDRRAVVKRKSNCYRVVDYSKPIKMKCHRSSVDHSLIIGWEPMERETA